MTFWYQHSDNSWINKYKIFWSEAGNIQDLCDLLKIMLEKRQASSQRLVFRLWWFWNGERVKQLIHNKEGELFAKVRGQIREIESYEMREISWVTVLPEKLDVKACKGFLRNLVKKRHFDFADRKFLHERLRQKISENVYWKAYFKLVEVVSAAGEVVNGVLFDMSLLMHAYDKLYEKSFFVRVKQYCGPFLRGLGLPFTFFCQRWNRQVFSFSSSWQKALSFFGGVMISEVVQQYFVLPFLPTLPELYCATMWCCRSSESNFLLAYYYLASARPMFSYVSALPSLSQSVSFLRFAQFLSIAKVRIFGEGHKVEQIEIPKFQGSVDQIKRKYVHFRALLQAGFCFAINLG